MPIEYMIIVFLVFLLYSVTTWMSSIENFENEEGITYESPAEIYDEAYAAIYNMIWHSNEKLQFEQISMQDISLADWPKDSVKAVDMCSGTAPHACWFKNLGVDYVGVDVSDAMIAQARKACPGAKFQKGDITQVQLFPQKSASHCLLMNFSAYQFENPKIVSDNAYQWLQPGGYFVVHLVDPDNYDPLHDLATPFAAFSLQKYALERQTESNIYFDKFKYTGKLIKKRDEDSAEYNEIFTYYDKDDNNGNKYRENKHHWSMPSKERMIDIFKTSGFTFVEAVPMLNVGKEYQYICYFTK
jgi:ubiquinone/menaquinone biosynthesis C-methylase UbiE